MRYFIEVIMYTATMMAIYGLLLRNRPFFALSRIYLLSAAVLPFVFPLLSLPVAIQQKVPAGPAFNITLPVITIGNSSSSAKAGGEVNLVLYIYAGICLVSLIWNFAGLLRIRNIIAGSNTKKEDGYTLLLSTGYGPGSFGRYIFFPGNEVDPVVLAHERAHISRWHSVDIMLLSLLQSLFWPDFFLFWIKRELREVHEFEADAIAAGSTRQYAHTLLAAAFQVDTIDLMHSFINQSIKRRIMMLSKKDGKASPLKAVVMVCCSLFAVVAVGLCMQGCTKKIVEPNAYGKTSRHADGPVYAYVDSMPRFEGELSTYLASSLKYPEDARKKGIQGRVIVKFVVGKDGAVLDPQIIKSPDTSLSSAALTAIGGMPAWKPGHTKEGEPVNVWFTLPVQFKM